MKNRDILDQALKQMNININSRAMQLFELYYHLLRNENEKINLISKKDEQKIITRHFLESIGILRQISFPEKCRVLDLGSGAGLPGIPIKIVRPDIEIFLVESKKKKARFIAKAVNELELPGASIIAKRVEDTYQEIEPVDFVVSRGVAELKQLYKWCRKIINPFQGRLITIKGPNYTKEIKRLLKPSSINEKISCKTEPYDPFPGLYTIRKCFLIDIKMKTGNGQ